MIFITYGGRGGSTEFVSHWEECASSCYRQQNYARTSHVEVDKTKIKSKNNSLKWHRTSTLRCKHSYKRS